MFYQFLENGMCEAAPGQIDSSVLTIGYLTVDELSALNHQFDFDESTILSCKNANTFFRSGVEVHRDYTFSELRIMNLHEEADDYIALYMKKNLMLVVDISDEDGSTKEKYLSAVNRYPIEKVCSEKVLASFLDSLVSGDSTVLEALEDELAEQEEAMITGEPGKAFSIRLLKVKKLISKRHTYYAQLLDIAEAVCENDTGIFDEASLIYVDNVAKKLSRLLEETASLKNTVEHLQDAYSSYLDSRMNSTMKIFTVLTSIFFPLTIIVGWYGMNFQYMPEFTWKYGYVYVILLSAFTVLVFALIGKKKKWF